MNPAWCRQYATSFIPVRSGCLNSNRFECAALSCTAYPCCLFHSATHPFWPSSTLRFSHHGNLPGTITLWALRSLEPRSTHRAVFSGHCHSLWGETGTAHISRERPGNWWNRPDSNWWPPDPKSGALPTALRLHIGGRWRSRTWPFGDSDPAAPPRITVTLLAVHTYISTPNTYAPASSR